MRKLSVKDALDCYEGYVRRIAPFSPALNIIISASLILYILYYVYLVQNFSANVMYFYTPDSWYYWAISESYGTDHVGRANIIRQYQFMTDHNMSFPPLWPLVIHYINTVGHFGYYAGLVSASIFFGLSVCLIEVLYFRLSGRHYAGVLFGILILGYRPYALDLMAGLSASLNIFLLVLSLFVFCSHVKNKIFILGVACGLLFLNRFDNALIILALFLMCVISSRNEEVGFGGVFIRYSLGFFLVVSPYVIGNIVQFGVPFISDNSIVFKAIGNVYSTFYFQEAPKVLTDDPIGWMNKIWNNLPAVYEAIKGAGLLFGIALVVVAFFGKKVSSYGLPNVYLAILLVSSSLVIFILAGVGYSDLRYFIPVCCVGLLILCNKFVELNAFSRLLVIVIVGIQVRHYMFSDHLFFYQTRTQKWSPEFGQGVKVDSVL